MILDALAHYEKVRKMTAVHSQVVLVATGINRGRTASRVGG